MESSRLHAALSADQTENGGFPEVAREPEPGEACVYVSHAVAKELRDSQVGLQMWQEPKAMQEEDFQERISQLNTSGAHLSTPKRQRVAHGTSVFKTDSFSPKSTIAAARAAGRKTKARIRARELEEKQMNDNKWLPRMTRREGVSVEGQDSFPGQGLSEARALRGLGISTQNLAEKHSVLQKKRLPFRNMPPSRPAISPRGYAAGTAQIKFP